jgi:hypothetical protein
MPTYQVTITTTITPEQDMPQAKIVTEGHLAQIIKGELEGKTNYKLEVKCEKV